jgi:hypothetical protein
MLDSFLMPTLADLRSSLQDPHEIQLNDPPLKQNATSFDRYGIGSIAGQPRVRKAFFQMNQPDCTAVNEEVKKSCNSQRSLVESADQGSTESFEIIDSISNPSTASSLKHMMAQTARSLNEKKLFHESTTRSASLKPSQASILLHKVCQSILGKPFSQNINSNADEQHKILGARLHEVVTEAAQSHDRLTTDSQQQSTSTKKRARPYDSDKDAMESLTLADVSSALADYGMMMISMEKSNDSITIPSDEVTSPSKRNIIVNTDKSIVGIDFNGKLVFEPSRASQQTASDIIPNENLSSIVPFALLSVTKPSSQHSINDITGRWGEALVFHYLTLMNPASKVTWLNLLSESQASYDITVESTLPTHPASGRTFTLTTFVEVKSTRSHDRNVCELSLYEWQFASALPKVQVRYSVCAPFTWVMR